jgi:hypothetical protein
MSADDPIRSEAQQLAEVINSRLKAIYAMLNGTAADLSGLSTADKSSLVAACNELYTLINSISSAWADITGKPSTFPPDAHTHLQSEVTGLSASLGSKADTDGANINAASYKTLLSLPSDTTTSLGNKADTDGANVTASAFRSSLGLGASALSNQDVSTTASPTFAAITGTTGTFSGTVAASGTTTWDSDLGMFPSAIFSANGDTNTVVVGRGANSQGHIRLKGSNHLTINAQTGLSCQGFVDHTTARSRFIQGSNGALSALVAKGRAGQTADIFSVVDSGDSLLLGVSPSGNLEAVGWVKSGSMTVAVATASSSATAVAAGAGARTYISNETGGATPAWSDGTVWRRPSDRAPIS